MDAKGSGGFPRARAGRDHRGQHEKAERASAHDPFLQRHPNVKPVRPARVFEGNLTPVPELPLGHLDGRSRARRGARAARFLRFDGNTIGAAAGNGAAGDDRRRAGRDQQLCARWTSPAAPRNRRLRRRGARAGRARAGADDLIMLCARAFAGLGDQRLRSPTSRPTRCTGSQWGWQAQSCRTSARR